MLRQRPHGKSRGEVGTTRQWRLRDGVAVWPGCIMTTVLVDKASVYSRAFLVRGLLRAWKAHGNVVAGSAG